VGFESAAAAEGVLCVKNTFIHVNDDDEHDCLSVRPTKSEPSSPTRAVEQRPRPCPLGEVGLEALAAKTCDWTSVSPAVPPFRAQRKRVAAPLASSDSDAECRGKASRVFGKTWSWPASTPARSSGSSDVGFESAAAAEGVLCVKNTFIHVNDDDEHDCLSVRPTKSEPSSPTRAVEQRPRPCPLGEGGLEVEACDWASVSPAVLPCSAQTDCAASPSGTKLADVGNTWSVSTGISGGGSFSSEVSFESIAATESIVCVKNTFIHIEDDSERTGDECSSVRSTRSLPHSFRAAES